MNKPHTHRVLLATAVPKWFNCLGNFATIRVLMASQWRSASLNLLLLCQSLQEGFEVPKWFQLPLQSSCHGLRYVAVNSLFLRRKRLVEDLLMLNCDTKHIRTHLDWKSPTGIMGMSSRIYSFFVLTRQCRLLPSSCQGSLHVWPLFKI